MKKIFIRSPYFIEINETGQIGSKVELFLYNKGTSVPSTPTYTLSKKIASPTQTKNTYNISNYAKGYIKPIAPVNVSVPTEENVNTWCYCQVKRYKETGDGYTLLDTETFVCLNGYTNYSSGYNQSNSNAVVPLANGAITFQKSAAVTPYVNVFYEQGDYEVINYGTLTVAEATMYKLPLTEDLNGDDYFEYNSIEVCEPIYTPIICTFINRYGGWQYLTFFKANQQSIDVTSKDFNLMPSAVNYNVLQGQKQRFNFQGTQKIKCNTGFVDENYSELIQDLMLSEVVLLDNKPAIVKSTNFEVKTKLKNNNINYEIDFEFNYGLINDVI